MTFVGLFFHGFYSLLFTHMDNSNLDTEPSDKWTPSMIPGCISWDDKLGGCFNRVLTQQETDQVTAYLAHLHGITIPVSVSR